MVCVAVDGGPIGADPDPVAAPAGGGSVAAGGGCCVVCAIAAPLRRRTASEILNLLSMCDS